MDIKHIQELLKAVNKSNISELKVKDKDYEITIKQSFTSAEPQVITTPVYAAPAPIAAPVTAPSAPEAAPVAAPATTPAADQASIKAPMIGTFYRSPSPDKPSFVNVGDEVKKGQVVCIIEAMKLFNEIEAEQSGRIIKVLVDDATPVEYDQPLFLIEA